MIEHRDGTCFVEDVSLERIAERTGTPVFVYSTAHFTRQYQALTSALSGLDHRIYYAVKANSNLSVMQLFQSLGAGFDIVSGGELERALKVGAPPEAIVFSGVGKRVEEIDFALKLGIGCFNVESAAELDRIADRAKLLHRKANIALRINPDIDAQTHPYISTGLKENKFGVPIEQAIELYTRASQNSVFNIIGIDCHIGSQIAEPKPLLEAVDALLQLRERLATLGIPVRHLDLGGGLGIAYQNEPDFDVAAYGLALRSRLLGQNVSVGLEPGRFLVGNGGLLLTRVEYLKPAARDSDKHFAVVDAAMTEIIRPALYSAWHDVVPVRPSSSPVKVWDVVGPVCESADFLARARALALDNDSLLAVMSAGAYCFVQSSNYNTRPRPPEVLVCGDAFKVVRQRETYRDLLAREEECL